MMMLCCLHLNFSSNYANKSQTLMDQEYGHNLHVILILNCANTVQTDKPAFALSLCPLSFSISFAPWDSSQGPTQNSCSCWQATRVDNHDQIGGHGSL